MSRLVRFASLTVLLVAPVAATAASSATRPAAATPTADVYVAAFRPVTDAGAWPWAGQAVQQNLIADLARSPFRPAAGTPTDADPLAAARGVGARFLVTGTYQWSDPRLRFDAQIQDTATGAVITGLSATGNGQDLFALEDDLSAQLARGLTRATHRSGAPATARPVPPALRPAAVATAIQPPAAGTASTYDGSALQAYVDANRTPSTDFDQQLTDARDRNTFGSYNNYGGPDGFGYGGLGLGGFGGYLPGVSYPIAGGGPFGYAPYGYGGFGYAASSYGGSGYGRGGFGFGHGGSGRIGGFSLGFGGRGGLR